MQSDLAFHTRFCIINFCRRTHFKEIDSFQSNNSLDSTKLWACGEDKIKVTQAMIYVFGMIENILGKGENACYQHFLLFPTKFSKRGFLRVVKTLGWVVKG